MANEIISRRDARAQGLKRFFTNIHCSHGHLSERFVRDGACVACVYKKNASWAKANPEKKRASLNRWIEANSDYVKASQKAYHSAWYKANRSEKLAKNADYLRENPEVARRSSRKWRNSNIEISREACRAWEKANSEKRSVITKRAYRANPDHYRAKNAKWAKDNPEKKSVVDRRRRARKKNASGIHTAADLADILKMQGNRCAYCKTSLDKVKKHVDHIVPLALGGSNGRENLQLTCQSCNNRKSAKDPTDFARSIGLLL